MKLKYRLKATVFFMAIVACIALGGFYGAKTLGLAIVVVLLMSFVVLQDIRALRKANRKISFIKALNQSIDNLMTLWFK